MDNVLDEEWELYGIDPKKTIGEMTAKEFMNVLDCYIKNHSFELMEFVNWIK